MGIAENIIVLRDHLPENVRLVAVSKTNPVERILEAYQCGQKIFGENRVQEIEEKHLRLPQEIEWHFIGHLQTNKVRIIAPFISMIQSVDSLKLLQEINKEALKNQRIIDCLLELYIASEETKYGLHIEEIAAWAQAGEFTKLSNVRMRGVMGMATFTNDMTVVRNEFKMLYNLFNTLKSGFFSNDDSFREVSMGMSGDYSIAIEEGSTMVRIGTSIFGER